MENAGSAAVSVSSGIDYFVKSYQDGNVFEQPLNSILEPSIESNLVTLNGDTFSLGALKKFTEIEIQSKCDSEKIRNLEKQLRLWQEKLDQSLPPLSQEDTTQLEILINRLCTTQQKLEEANIIIQKQTQQINTTELALQTAENHLKIKIKDLEQKLKEKTNEASLIQSHLELNTFSEDAAEQSLSELSNLQQLKEQLKESQNELLEEKKFFFAKQEELAFRTKDLELRLELFRSEQNEFQKQKMEFLAKKALAKNKTADQQTDRSVGRHKKRVSFFDEQQPKRRLSLASTNVLTIEGNPQITTLQEQLNSALSVQAVLRRQLETLQKMNQPSTSLGNRRRTGMKGTPSRSNFPSNALSSIFVKEEESTDEEPETIGSQPVVEVESQFNETPVNEIALESKRRRGRKKEDEIKLGTAQHRRKKTGDVSNKPKMSTTIFTISTRTTPRKEI